LLPSTWLAGTAEVPVRAVAVMAFSPIDPAFSAILSMSPPLSQGAR
jgi:hypothetical protein